MELKTRYNNKSLIEFSNELIELNSRIGFKVSARGWAYIMEQKGLITKASFDKVNNIINTCRKRGFLPIDFVAEESARQFTNVLTAYNGTVVDRFIDYLDFSLQVHKYMDLDWWRGEEYYIQMVVEKVDLVSLFLPVCIKYKIPIANSKGWSSMLQRAEYARRFKEAQDNGLKCVLLYCGDHDPDGLRIGEFLRKNLSDLNKVTWTDGEIGYNPEDLIIDRFGLNYDFIEENNFTWIDNLITGSTKNLASPSHPNYSMPYVQNYLRDIGERKCEANVIVTLPKIARDLCTEAIEKYLGTDALNRFSKVRGITRNEFNKFKMEEGITKKVNDIILIARDYKI